MELLFKNLFIKIYDDVANEKLVLEKKDGHYTTVSYGMMMSAITNDVVMQAIELFMDDMPYVAVMKTIEDYKSSNMFQEIEKLMEE